MVGLACSFSCWAGVCLVPRDQAAGSARSRASYRSGCPASPGDGLGDCSIPFFCTRPVVGGRLRRTGGARYPRRGVISALVAFVPRKASLRRLTQRQRARVRAIRDALSTTSFVPLGPRFVTAPRQSITWQVTAGPARRRMVSLSGDIKRRRDGDACVPLQHWLQGDPGSRRHDSSNLDTSTWSV